jgi:glycerol-3-phosphate dehydrogenase (NAD(P)+)
MKKIAYFGAGTWGIALSTLLVENGREVVVWTRNRGFADQLEAGRRHPKLPDFEIPLSIRFTSEMDEALDGADAIVESVTTAGLRPVFEEIVKRREIEVPVILTSKGIEQGTGLLLPEVVSDVMGVRESPWVGVLSGPSHAEEVVGHLPTSVVCSAYGAPVIKQILDLFTTPRFRIYPNADIRGVSFGGAMKNIIAIACGIAEGLGCGDNTKAALMTRGLHEMRKLSVVKGARPETLNGLSGMGDLCVTCMSRHSRNYRFGRLVAEGLSPEKAKKEIGMAVEGIYSCVSARELGRKANIPIPITEATFSIIYERLDPKEAVKQLLQRAIKEEHL